MKQINLILSVVVIVTTCVAVVSCQSCVREARDSLSGSCKRALDGVFSAEPTTADLSNFCEGDCLQRYYCSLEECANSTSTTNDSSVVAAAFNPRIWCAHDSMNRRCRTVRLNANLTVNVTTACTQAGANCTDPACRTAINEFGCCIYSYIGRFPLVDCGLDVCTLQNFTCAATTPHPVTISTIVAIVTSLIVTTAHP